MSSFGSRGAARARVIVMSTVQIVCEALRAGLQRDQSIHVLEHETSLQGIARACESDPNVIVVCDGSSTDALRFLAAASRRLAHCRLVVFGTPSTKAFLRLCAHVQVKSLVSRKSTLRELIYAIRRVAEEGSFLSPALRAHFREAIRHSPIRKLTTRERDIAWLISRRMTNKQIAGRLRVSEHTVKVHVRHILAKLEARGRGDVAAAIGHA